MTHYHSAFGWRIASDLHFPELPAAAPGEPDVVFRREAFAGEPLSRWKNRLMPDRQFLVEDGQLSFRMVVRDRGTVLYDAPPEHMTLDGRAHLLTHGFPALLHLRGIAPVHANTLCDPDGRHAIAVAGHKGAGKSTSSLALLERGWRLVCDDLCAARIDGGSVTALPGFPRLKLWPESLTMFGHDPESFRRLWVSLDKRHFPLDAARFHPHPVPLRHMFLLQVSNEARALQSRELSGVEKIVWLKRNLLAAATQASDLDPGLVIGHLAELARLVPMTLIERPMGEDTLAAVADLLTA